MSNDYLTRGLQGERVSYHGAFSFLNNRPKEFLRTLVRTRREAIVKTIDYASRGNTQIHPVTKYYTLGSGVARMNMTRSSLFYTPDVWWDGRNVQRRISQEPLQYLENLHAWLQRNAMRIFFEHGTPEITFYGLTPQFIDVFGPLNQSQSGHFYQAWMQTTPLMVNLIRRIEELRVGGVLPREVENDFAYVFGTQGEYYLPEV